jgi:hypothetical protein
MRQKAGDVRFILDDGDAVYGRPPSRFPAFALTLRAERDVGATIT